jgi:hypothetical protein
MFASLLRKVTSGILRSATGRRDARPGNRFGDFATRVALARDLQGGRQLKKYLGKPGKSVCFNKFHIVVTVLNSVLLIELPLKLACGFEKNGMTSGVNATTPGYIAG